MAWLDCDVWSSSSEGSSSGDSVLVLVGRTALNSVAMIGVSGSGGRLSSLINWIWRRVCAMTADRRDGGRAGASGAVGGETRRLRCCLVRRLTRVYSGSASSEDIQKLATLEI